MHNYCKHCNELKKENQQLQNKIKKYEKLLDGYINLEKQNCLYESVILDKQNLKLNNGEDYIVIEELDKLDELSKKEKKIIQTQDTLAKITTTKNYIKKFGNVYGWGASIIAIGKYVIAWL